MKTNYHTTNRVLVNDEYAAIIGKAVYLFFYYEWTLIYIIDSLNHGFVKKYCRPSGKPLTSRAVKDELDKSLKNLKQSTSAAIIKDITTCSNLFGQLILKRNALIHAHPITDNGGNHILSYRSNSSKPISDMKWPMKEVAEFVREIDKAVVIAGGILFKLRAENKI